MFLLGHSYAVTTEDLGSAASERGEYGKGLSAASYGRFSVSYSMISRDFFFVCAYCIENRMATGIKTLGEGRYIAASGATLLSSAYPPDLA